MSKQFGDERRTTIDVAGLVNAPITEVASLHEREPLIIAFTRNSTLKALPIDSYKPKGKGADAQYASVRGDEQLKQVIATTSQDYLLCISSTGRVFQIATHRIPPGTRPAKGEPINKLLELAPGESVVTILPIEAYAEDRYLVTFSRLGKVKKSPLSEYKTADVDGLADMKLADGDSVVTALLSHGQGEYLVTTDSGQTLRFADDALRAQGRVGQGVAAISLNKGAVVVSAVSLDASAEPGSMDLTSLFIVTALGSGKKVPLSQYPLKARASVGVASTELSSDDHVLTTLLLNEGDTLLLTWTPGSGEQVKLLPSATLQTFLRTRPGVQLVEGQVLQVVKI